MALEDKIPQILAHVRQHEDYLQFNFRLYRMFEGQIREEVEKSLREEIISYAAYERAIKRIPSINIIRKAVNKLSKVYVEPPTRLTDKKQDREIMDNIVKGSDFDVVMSTANEIYNLHKGCLIEPYVKDGCIKLRVLAYHQFLPFSDDMIDPTNMTVLIKFLGREKRVVEEVIYDTEGNRNETQKVVKEVEVMALYSDEEFMIIDSSGSIRRDKMEEMGITSTENPFGVIPAVYVNSSQFELVPYPNQEGFDISILIPKLLTDLNYAAQFMSHSIIYTKNTDISGQEINPDAVVNLGDDDPEGGKPEIGTIDPKVEYESILQLAQFEASWYFASIGIKTSMQGSAMPGREASGFAKAMDEGDVTQERKVQTEVFRSVEAELWDVISQMQAVWANESGKLKESRKFTQEFTDTFSVKFGEMKILKSRKQLLEEIKLEREEKLMGRRQALRALHPDFTEGQIDEWIKELDNDLQEEMEASLASVESFNRAQQERGVPSTNSVDKQMEQDETENQRKEELGE